MDSFAAKRSAMRAEFFGKLFLLGGWLGGTDTYKRTMWAAVPDIAVSRAGYALTMRKGLPEPGADNQLIMAGHETMLAQWFHRPLRRADIELARELDLCLVRDKIAHHHVIPTPETTFEELWQQLRVDLDARDA